MNKQNIEWAPEEMAKVCLENGYNGKIYYNPVRITKADADEFMKKKKIIWQRQ